MNKESPSPTSHPTGDPQIFPDSSADGPVSVDTYAGRVSVDWDDTAKVTPLGHLAFFVEYLKLSGRFDALVADCPLVFTSPNRPEVRDLLGTAMLSVLGGHWRYAHMTALRGDRVSADLLGMKRIRSEDSVRRGIGKIDAEEGEKWLCGHLMDTLSPILSEPWILDCDTTIKPLYGHQQGAVLGYNPHKPGRPSHALHSFQISSVRLILDVVVKPGNETSSKHSEPHIWPLLKKLPCSSWPAFVRGDKDWGNERNMARCEQEGLPYLFKLRLTKGVKRLAEKLMKNGKWMEAGQGWEGQEATLRLDGWRHQRRVIVLRRRLPLTPGKLVTAANTPDQFEFYWPEEKRGYCEWEISVLVTSIEGMEILSLAQLYRDRGDSENPFDELKNQWGWGGFTTHDITRCQIMARMVALFYNWWSLYVRLSDPNQHREALTTRSLLLNAVAKQTRHAGQTRITVTSMHGRREEVRRALQKLAEFFAGLHAIAEQLTVTEIWTKILRHALQKYLGNRNLHPPPLLLTA